MAKKMYLTARVTETLKQQIERIAKDERRSVSQVAEMLLESAIEKRKNGKGV